MTGDPGDWLCVGDFCTGAAPLLGGSVAAAFALARTALPRRVIVDRWIRYRISLDSARTGPTDARLTPVTDDLVQALRQHPESAANQLKSGLRFWDHGLTRAYVWLNGSEPICIQWLLTSADSPRLRPLAEVGGRAPAAPRGLRAGRESLRVLDREKEGRRDRVRVCAVRPDTAGGVAAPHHPPPRGERGGPRLGRPHRLAGLRHHHALSAGPAGTAGAQRVLIGRAHVWKSSHVSE